jgi:hypothetical protein
MRNGVLAVLVLVLVLQQLPVEPRQLGEQTPEFVVAAAHGARLGDEVFAKVTGDGFAGDCGGQIVTAHGGGPADRADEQVQRIRDLAFEQCCSWICAAKLVNSQQLCRQNPFKSAKRAKLLPAQFGGATKITVERRNTTWARAATNGSAPRGDRSLRAGPEDHAQ